MGKDDFELPDMEDLAKQMEEATAEVEEAMKGLGELGSVGGIMGSLTELPEDMPGDLGDLAGALGEFEQQHEENVESAAGEPDWALEARIRVGKKLDLAVRANLSLKTVRQAWESTQGAGFESVVGETLAGAGVEVADGEMGQILEQLGQGRSMAVVEEVDVLAVRMQGAPADAKESVQLSPEANIPLSMDEKGLKLELAPLLTIRNKWENADIPTFTPMAEQLVVPLDRFDGGEAFDLSFSPTNQDEEVTVDLSLRPLQ